MKCTIHWIAGFALAAAALSCPSSSHAVAVLSVPTDYSASSQHSAPFAPIGLFDETVEASDLNTTVFGEAGALQWAGNGPGPHQLFVDYGSTITASGLAYAQRQGADTGANDKVGAIELWFSDTPFDNMLPLTDPDAVISAIVPSPNTGLLVHYSLGGVHSGRYVAANVTPLDPNITPTNVGGSELRLTIPEPSSLLVAVVGVCTSLTTLRGRRCR